MGRFDVEPFACKISHDAICWTSGNAAGVRPACDYCLSSIVCSISPSNFFFHRALHFFTMVAYGIICDRNTDDTPIKSTEPAENKGSLCFFGNCTQNLRFYLGKLIFFEAEFRHRKLQDFTNEVIRYVSC